MRFPAQPGLWEHRGSGPALEEGCLEQNLGTTTSFVDLFQAEEEDSEAPKTGSTIEPLGNGISTCLRKLALQSLFVATRRHQRVGQRCGARQKDAFLPTAMSSLHLLCWGGVAPRLDWCL